MVRSSNLARERAALRAGASFLLKADVNQFYPSLYTHAVGWAVDPVLRHRTNWKRPLLGKKLDQALMDLDGKISQGIPIGNDLSYLLAELVLARVDKVLRLRRDRSFRWFDDYEAAFDTREDAQACLKNLRRELGRFRLRLNPNKTTVMELPQPAGEEWQESLLETSKSRFRVGDIVNHFDSAFRLRDRFPSSPVLLYALGVLFALRCPFPDVRRVAQSCLTQAVLCEPGAAQKAFALLSYWRLNWFSLDQKLIAQTADRLLMRHEAGGLSSDVAWALAFCLEQRLTLGAKAGKLLSIFEDDCIALQALYMHSMGLLPQGFKTQQISTMLKSSDLDREHSLIAYESTRQGFLKDAAAAVKANPLFSDLLARKVTFYRTRLPVHALVLHPGGAPPWTVARWLDAARHPERPTKPDEKLPADSVFKLVSKDVPKLEPAPESPDDAVAGLMNLLEGFRVEPYSA